ncbi:glycosyltransferase family 1 protein, partial [Paenibacillus sepulcri]|nr:glycosyltransferase family 1 protein [Paenibacillus sepulcri]
MPPKILFVATLDTHFRAFHLPVMRRFKEQGWEVHVAAKGDSELPFTDQKFNISIERSPLRLSNIKGCRQLKLLMERNDYRIVHCHTPMGGVLTRLAA